MVLVLRTSACLLLLLLLISPASGQTAAGQASPGSTTVTYALWQLESIGIPADDARSTGWHLRAALGEVSCVRLLERERMEELAQEAGLGLTYVCSSTECLVELGELLQAQRVIGGALTRVGDVYGIVAVVVDTETGEQLTQAEWFSEPAAPLSGILTGGVPNIRAQLADALCDDRDWEQPGTSRAASDSTDWPGGASGEITAKLTRVNSAGGRSEVDVPYLPPGRKIATLETTKGKVRIELWEDRAPNTVVNFVYLANSGRYDGVEFHRVIDGFMAQTGDVEHKGGYGGPGYSIPAEFNADLSHTEGVVSMARSQDPDSAGSQFFIMLGAAPHLDGQYAAFGKVVSGMDVIHRIKKGDRARNGTVDDPDKIVSVRVESAP